MVFGLACTSLNPIDITKFFYSIKNGSRCTYLYHIQLIALSDCKIVIYHSSLCIFTNNVS